MRCDLYEVWKKNSDDDFIIAHLNKKVVYSERQ